MQLNRLSTSYRWPLHSYWTPQTESMRRLHLLNIKFGRKGRSVFFIMWIPSGSFQFISISGGKKQWKKMFAYISNIWAISINWSFTEISFHLNHHYIPEGHTCAWFEFTKFLLTMCNSSCPRYFQIKWLLFFTFVGTEVLSIWLFIIPKLKIDECSKPVPWNKEQH